MKSLASLGVCLALLVSDAMAQSRIRAVHASPDAPPVDIYDDGQNLRVFHSATIPTI